MEFNLFGLKITNKKEEIPKKSKIETFVPKEYDDGAIQISSTQTYGSTRAVIDISGSTKNDSDLINSYRNISMISEVDTAIEDIVTEAIISDENEDPVKLNLTQLKLPDSTKKKMTEEFSVILNLMQFKLKGHDIFKRWYIDGRYYLHILIDENNPQNGIYEVRYVDPCNLKKVREKIKDNNHLMEMKKIFPFVESVGQEISYWVYIPPQNSKTNRISSGEVQGLRISEQSIAYTNSGIIDPSRKTILSFLHKAIRPANQLNMLEDAQVIYAYTRAPERRAIYIDTGTLPEGLANQHVDNVINRMKDRISYDSESGQIREGRRFMALTEDFYIPRRGGSAATEIVPLEGGQNLGVTDQLEYFLKKLYKALNIPFSHVSDGTQFSFGDNQAISRDEAKYARFVARLRTRFSMIFDQLLSRQLSLKGIMTLEEWDDLKDDVHYDFLRDNHFSELLDQAILGRRLAILDQITPFIDIYFSKEYVQEKILQQTDEEIEDLEAQRAGEIVDRPSVGFTPGADVEYPENDQKPIQESARTIELRDILVANVRTKNYPGMDYDIDGIEIE